MLAGALTQEDEDAVLAELEAIAQVGMGPNALLFPFSRSHAGQVAAETSAAAERARCRREGTRLRDEDV